MGRGKGGSYSPRKMDGVVGGSWKGRGRARRDEGSLGALTTRASAANPCIPATRRHPRLHYT